MVSYSSMGRKHQSLHWPDELKTAGTARWFRGMCHLCLAQPYFDSNAGQVLQAWKDSKNLQLCATNKMSDRNELLFCLPEPELIGGLLLLRAWGAVKGVVLYQLSFSWRCEGTCKAHPRACNADSSWIAERGADLQLAASDTCNQICGWQCFYFQL